MLQYHSKSCIKFFSPPRFHFHGAVDVGEDKQFLKSSDSVWRVLFIIFCVMFVLLMSALDYAVENNFISLYQDNKIENSQVPHENENEKVHPETTTIPVKSEDSTNTTDIQQEKITTCSTSSASTENRTSSKWPNSRSLSAIIGNTESDPSSVNIEDQGTQETNIEHENKARNIQRKVSLHSIVKAFSIQRNLPKIFNISNSHESDLQCLHGLRFLSMTWVILGHTFYFSITYLDNPLWAAEKIQNSLSMEAVEQGLFSVDTFFFLSGLLVSYIFIKRKMSVKTSTNPLMWAKIILHRFIRLLPPYFVLVVLLGL